MGGLDRTKLVIGRDPARAEIVSVLVKRSYRLDPVKRITEPIEAEPWISTPVVRPIEGRLGCELVHDFEWFPWKSCTDVIVRAVRNAGVDLQKALHEDIARSRKSYPMVKGNGDTHIDHRRVKTLLPYFKRHWEVHSARLDDPKDPLRPGDVIFMDTFPSRSGPDHIGIISDTIGDAGLPLVINNWTNGTVTSEMDLLTFVPVLHRFRLPE